jgi:hypothetical protein
MEESLFQHVGNFQAWKKITQALCGEINDLQRPGLLISEQAS